MTRILLVDDEEYIRRFYVEELSDEGDRANHESENGRVLHRQAAHYRQPANLFTGRDPGDAKGFPKNPNPNFRWLGGSFRSAAFR